MPDRPPRIGLSACFLHADPERALYKGKTLLYLEEEMAHWLMSRGALVYMLPSSAGPIGAADLMADLDGLVLQGGADVAPQSYGEEPMEEAWSGDAIRDAYEIELVEATLEQGKPILGLCRGIQLLNVALGGTLYQDIRTQNPGALEHRDWEIYDQNFHEVRFEEGSLLAELYGTGGGTVNSVHHQAVKEPGEGVIVEATSSPDGIIEAIRLADPDRDHPWVYGIQWHPEWMAPDREDLLDMSVVLERFMEEL